MRACVRPHLQARKSWYLLHPASCDATSVHSYIFINQPDSRSPWIIFMSISKLMKILLILHNPWNPLYFPFGTAPPRPFFSCHKGPSRNFWPIPEQIVFFLFFFPSGWCFFHWFRVYMGILSGVHDMILLAADLLFHKRPSASAGLKVFWMQVIVSNVAPISLYIMKFYTTSIFSSLSYRSRCKRSLIQKNEVKDSRVQTVQSDTIMIKCLKAIQRLGMYVLTVNKSCRK